MGWSTSVVVPPHGHMGAYIRNLERLLARGDRIYYPTHGAPIEQPQAFVRALIRHRRKREADIIACLRAGLDAIPAIVARLYQGVPLHLHAAAAQSVLAHLIDLQERGLVTAAAQDRFLLR
jgi:glyoxylase-like metal-dependent hydrolase (beta-lactamase superfamily II)